MFAYMSLASPDHGLMARARPTLSTFPNLMTFISEKERLTYQPFVVRFCLLTRHWHFKMRLFRTWVSPLMMLKWGPRDKGAWTCLLSSWKWSKPLLRTEACRPLPAYLPDLKEFVSPKPNLLSLWPNPKWSNVVHSPLYGPLPSISLVELQRPWAPSCANL